MYPCITLLLCLVYNNFMWTWSLSLCLEKIELINFQECLLFSNGKSAQSFLYLDHQGDNIHTLFIFHGNNYYTPVPPPPLIMLLLAIISLIVQLMNSGSYQLPSLCCYKCTSRWNRIWFDKMCKVPELALIACLHPNFRILDNLFQNGSGDYRDYKLNEDNGTFCCFTRI